MIVCVFFSLAPLQLQDTEVLVDRVTNSSFRVTVNLAIFTDYFRNHQFRVSVQCRIMS